MARTYYTLLLLCLMTQGHAAEDAQYYCPDGGWHLVEDACFMVTDPMSWYEARDYCQSLPKANLAFFDTHRQYVMAASMAAEEPTWIGLSSGQPRADRKYAWINNVNGQPSFTAWGENEPSLGSDSCVSIVKAVSPTEGGWQDDPCYMKLPFICQTKKGDSACRSGWFEDRQTGVCYFHSGLLLSSWFQSKAYCLTHDAQLASPDTQRANTFIQSSVMPQVGSAWIGMWDPNMNDTWEWFYLTGQVNWTNWIAGQPDNGGRLALHCTTLGCGVPGGWLRDHCTAHYPFVCEKVIKEDSAQCPEAWEEGTWNNSGTPKHCLKVTQSRVTWHEARQACRALGADLVTMDTKDKAAWIKDTFLGGTRECAGRRWWMGLNSLQEGLRWTWLDSTALISYADWQTDPAFPHRGDPNHGGGGHDWDMVYDYYDAVDGAVNGHDRKSQGRTYPVAEGDPDDDYWDYNDDRRFEADDYDKYKESEKFGDIAAALQQHALSGEHYDDKAVLMLTVGSVRDQCVGCWLNVPHTADFPALCEMDHLGCVETGHPLQYGGHCYTVLHPGPWAAQQDQCKYMMGGASYLAVIDNQLEQDYLTGALKNVEEAAPGVYIGLNAFAKPYHFKWLINDTFYANVSTASTFTNWLPGEPHRHPSHGCVMAGPNTVNSMVWSDANCLLQAPALCRRKPLNASVYYDFKLRDSIYKVTHQKVGAATDLQVLCSELLGQGAHLVQVDTLLEYHLLTNLLHYEFSGSVDLWVGNFSRILVWGTHHIAPPKVVSACPPVLSMTSGMPHIGKGDCCLSRYALCEKTVKGSRAPYDVRVGSKLYRFVSTSVNISYNDAQKACGKMTQGFYGRLLSITTPQEYMKLSAEMRVLQSPQDIRQYWISRSMSWMDYVGTNEFVVRNVDGRAHGVPCLVASLEQGTSRRLTKHDYLHLQPEACDKLMGGYICQSQLSLTQIRTEHTVLRRIFQDILTKYFRFNATAFRSGLRHKAVTVVTPAPPPACGPACVGLAVTLPIMCIAFFVVGFLLARFCRKGGYHLMISQSRRHRMDEMDIPFTTST